MLSDLLFLRIKNIFSIENILKYAHLFYLCDTIHPRDIETIGIKLRMAGASHRGGRGWDVDGWALVANTSHLRVLNTAIDE